MITQCSWCKRFKYPGNVWSGDEKMLTPRMKRDINKLEVSHDICPECNKRVREKNGMKPANEASLPPSSP